MFDIIELIKNTIEIIEETIPAKLLIYDKYGIFINTEIANFPQYNGWHTSPYCLLVKSSSNLYNMCRFLKKRMLKKSNYDDKITKTTCFCGVTEYTIPIKFNGKYLGLITITGFKGELKDYFSNIYARHLGHSLEDFIKFREKELVSTEKEKYVKTMLQIISHLFREFLKQKPSLFEKTTSNPYVLKALEYIHLNYNNNISVSAVAKECFISESYLQSLFSAYLGHGIADEIRIQQINYAKKLLSETEYSVKYISFLCGFSSPDYFCTVFKRETNITPLKYRKSH